MQANRGYRTVIGILRHVAALGSFKVAFIIEAKVGSH